MPMDNDDMVKRLIKDLNTNEFKMTEKGRMDQIDWSLGYAERMRGRTALHFLHTTHHHNKEPLQLQSASCINLITYKGTNIHGTNVQTKMIKIDRSKYHEKNIYHRVIHEMDHWSINKKVSEYFIDGYTFDTFFLFFNVLQCSMCKFGRLLSFWHITQFCRTNKRSIHL